MKRTIDTCNHARELHRTVVENLFRLKDQISSMSLEEMLDFACCVKETAHLLDDSRKECEDLQKTLEQVMCVVWIAKSLSTNKDDPIRSEYAVGTPRVKITMHIPKRGTEEYDALMTSMGVSNGDLVRPHWPSMVDHVSELLSKGKMPPPGMTGKTYNVHSVTIRKRKEFPNVKET